MLAHLRYLARYRHGLADPDQEGRNDEGRQASMRFVESSDLFPKVFGRLIGIPSRLPIECRSPLQAEEDIPTGVGSFIPDVN